MNNNLVTQAKEIIREMTKKEFEELMSSSLIEFKKADNTEVEISITKNSYAIYNEKNGLFRLVTQNYEYQYYWCSRGCSYPEFLSKLTKDYYCYSKLCVRDKKIWNKVKTFSNLRKMIKKTVEDNYSLGLNFWIKNKLAKEYMEEIAIIQKKSWLTTEKEMVNALSEIDYKYKAKTPEEKKFCEEMDIILNDYSCLSEILEYNPSAKHLECIKYFEKLKLILKNQKK